MTALLSVFVGRGFIPNNKKSYCCLETRQHIASDVFDKFVNLPFGWEEIKNPGAVLSTRMGGEVFYSKDTRFYCCISTA
ncbi:hypothetical protein [Candidatus Sororendozoicomonas aggregata]|uniref:hypothetical protein n=1 Tax=Candidatus Sororendozoicomonas aggregata TaxID=3073239 RepID=UPI002ED0375B